MKHTKYLTRCPKCNSRDYESEHEANDDELHEQRACTICGTATTLVFTFEKWFLSEEGDGD